MEIFDIIAARRSVRKYKPDPVDDNTLQKVLNAARLAPSWKNTQCWRFIVIRKSNLKAELAGCLTSGNPGYQAILQAPVLIVACAELGKSGLNAGTFGTDKGDWFMYDVALAMENLVLAAQALGLGTVHIGLFDAKKAAEALGVPQGFCVVSMTPLGYPDQESRTVPRKDLTEIVFNEKFGG